ncbi:MAG: D-2-hydroxyacid dehydrogenase [Rhodobacteraceae bacterium]|nr:D-2-hydroxyacid dehydrogenase [Paracoccaceae bacterium]
MTTAPRVLLHNIETDEMVTAFKAAFPDLEYEACDRHEDVAEALARFRPDVVYSIRYTGTAPYPREALLGADGPKWIAVGGSGTDHFGSWDTTRLTLTNAAGVAADMMAEYIFGGFLHFTLDVPGLQKDQADRVWDTRRLVRPLRGKTLLIVGLGHTGRAVAALGQAFGMRVLGTRARPVETEHVDQVFAAADLHDALPQADFIAVATPLLPSTRGLIGAEAVARMKPGVVIADVSRGGVMDHNALIPALQSGQIAGAALDVFGTEPLPQDDPIWACPNVLISPHCSSVHAEWEQASFAFFLRNLARYVAGETLLNIVDPARGY